MSLGLRLYLANAKRTGARLQKRAKLAKNPSRFARPSGRLLWLHACSDAEIPAIKELIRHLSAEHDQLSFLVTTLQNSPSDIRFQDCCAQPCLQITAPADTPQQVDDFLAHWQPSMAIWFGSVLRPALAVGSHKRGIKLFMINASEPASVAERPHYNKGITEDILGQFQHILAENNRIAAELVKQGAARQSVTVTGLLQEGGNTLYCDDRDREEMAQILAPRPLWLAAGITENEEEAVISVHRAASRLSHHLLLVLAPKNPDRGDEIARTLTAQGWIVSQRSQAQVPDEHAQIIIADADDEMGLWYRLAPVCFLGDSLDNAALGQSPFNAAALGCAILYGPNIDRHKAAYSRLNAAGAARKVENGKYLATGIQDLLAPDKAAKMAHAGWEVSTSGAEAAGHALELITAALDEMEGS